MVAKSSDKKRSKKRRSVANGETNDRVAKVVFDPPPIASTPSALTSHNDDVAKELAEDLIENIQEADIRCESTGMA